jgi:hypothetical protein
LQRTYRLEGAQTDLMVSLVANDNWVEFTLRYVVLFKRRRATKTVLYMAILKRIKATNGAIKFASATFQLVDSPALKVNIKKQD